MSESHRAKTLDMQGLTDPCRPELVEFGLRGTGLAITSPALRTAVDSSSGLTLFPLDDVFVGPVAAIGFGTPNTYLVVPDEVGGHSKLAAFMFWRQRAAVVPTKGRVQAGVLYELRDLPDGALEALRSAMSSRVGQRSISCAHLCAQTLADAGFAFGNGRSLRRIARPSKFASLLWRRGLSYTDQWGKTHSVGVRVVHASHTPFGEHFVNVWSREASSVGRTIRKLYTRHVKHEPAPVFEPRPAQPLNPERWTGRDVVVGMARSSRLGSHLGYLFGQKPLYTVKLPGLRDVPELQAPLPPFPAINDWVTALKRYVLFSRPVIALMNRMRVRSMDWYETGLKADTLIDMLRPSSSATYDTAVLYNCVVTSDEVRITGLHTDLERNKRSKLIHRIDWVAAKHVLLSNYSPDVVYACELWAYRDEQGKPVLCINSNSGTYQPDETRMEAIATFLRQNFRVQVRTFPI